MELAAAQASLAVAVASLFSASPEEADAVGECARCGRALGAPVAWRALRDVPVCWRWVLARWRRLADAKTPLPQQTAPPAATQAAIESRALSMARLCSALYQWGILTSEGSDDSEAVATAIQAATADGLSMDVLTRVLRSRSLAIRVRVKLFLSAVSGKRTESAAWVAGAATTLQEELRRASVDPAVSAPSAMKKTRKRRRDTGVRSAHSASCKRCDEEKGLAQAKESARKLLIRTLSTWIDAHEGDLDGPAVEEVRGLVEVLNAPDVCKLLEGRAGSCNDRLSGVARKTSRPHGETLRWGECDSIVEEVCAAETSSSKWLLVWRRERHHIDVTGTVGSASRLVEVCATADLFVSSTVQTSGMRRDDLGTTVGLRVIQAVLVRTTARVVPALQAVSAASKALSLPTPCVRFAKQRHLFTTYVRHLLTNHNEGTLLQLDDTVPSKKQPTPDKLTDLLDGLQSIYEVVHGGETFRGYSSVRGSELFDLWFEVIHRLSQDSGERTPLWSAFLDSVAQCCEELKIKPSQLSRCFEAFCAEVIVRLIASNGAQLSSPRGATVICVPKVEASQTTVHALICVVLAACASSEVVETILCRLCEALARDINSQNDVNSQSALGRVRSGIRRLLLPTLGGYLSGSSADALSSLISAVFSRFQSEVTTPRLARCLVELLFELDKYWETNRLDIVSGAAEEHWGRQRVGMQLIIELGVWLEFVQHYVLNPNKIADESADFQHYAIELLRNIDPTQCPAQLEGALFSVLAAGSSTASGAVQHARQPHFQHSDSSIDRLVQVFSTVPDHHLCGKLVVHLKHERKLEDLLLTLRRWLGILTSKTDVLPIETQNKLVMLTNRLIYWGGSECEVLKASLVPVDPALLAALQLYSRPPVACSSLPQPPSVSLVRLTVAIRSYLARSVVPDLIGLTTAIASATTCCTTATARDGLVKLVQGFGSFLMMPVLASSVRESLMLVGDRENIRNVMNALAIIRDVRKPAQSLAITLSCDVFSVATGELWLSAFLFAALVPSDTSHKYNQNVIFELLECVELLLRAHEDNEGGDRVDCHSLSVLRNAYALIATFSCVELALSIVGIDSPLHHQVARVHNNLILVTQPSNDAGAINDTEHFQRLIATSSNTQNASSPSGTRTFVAGVLQVSSLGGSVAIDEWRAIEENMGFAQAAFDSNVFGDHYRLFLPFSSWLKSAFKLPRDCASVSVEAATQSFWEAAFSEMALQFYLPVEFLGNEAAFTAEWLSVWIDESLNEGSTIHLIQSQRSILLDQVSSGNPWSYLLQCTLLLITHGERGRLIMNDISRLLDFVVICSLRPVDLEVFSSMADDIVSVVEKGLHMVGGAGSTDTLAIITPLVEVFVSIALRSMSSSPDTTTLLDDVKRVGVQIRSLLAVSESARNWWNERISAWRRLHSHRCRQIGSQQILDVLAL